MQRVIVPTHYTRAASEPQQADALVIKPEGALTLLRRCGAVVGESGLGSADESQLPIPVSRLNTQFSEAEKNPPVISYLATLLVGQADMLIPQVDAFCGVPDGGVVLAFALARYCNCRYKCLECNMAGGLQFGWHVLTTESVVLVKDAVLDNDAYIHQVIRVVEENDGAILGIFCVYNAHGEKDFHGVPITSLLMLEKRKKG